MLLFTGLENIGTTTSTNVDAQLTSLTSGVTVEADTAAYADITAAAVVTNSLPYQFSIDPLLPCGTDLDFHLVMTDSVSTYASDFSLNASVVLPRAEVISNTVEGDQTGWTTGGTLNTWTITDTLAHSPIYSWTDSEVGEYENDTNSYLRTPAFNLSGKRNVNISGWYQYNLESGYDYVYLEYSLNGGSTWNTAAPLAYFNGVQDTWEKLLVDASVLDNQPNVALRYHLVTDAGVVADGIYIDDIVVSYEPYECAYVPSGPPGAPLLISPPDAAVVQNPVAFEWQDSGTGGAPSGYIFNLDSTPVVTFTTPVTSTVMTLTAGNHDWSVIAFNDGGSSPESITQTVEVITPLDPPAVPLLISPEDGAIVTPGVITFTWAYSDTGEPAAGFVFMLDSTPVITETTPLTTTSLSLGSGPHTWSVSAFNEAGASDYAAERSLWVQFLLFLAEIFQQFP